MLRRFINTAGVCGVGCFVIAVLRWSVCGRCSNECGACSLCGTDDFWTRPYLFGDLGRTKLKEQGIDIGLTLGNESVGNLSGGGRNTAANAGQLWFGAKLDMGKAGRHSRRHGRHDAGPPFRRQPEYRSGHSGPATHQRSFRPRQYLSPDATLLLAEAFR